MSLNRAFPWLLIACIAASFALLATLLIDVAADGLSRVSVSFITDYASSVADNAGIRAALLGTIWLMVVCAAFIIPVGVATGSTQYKTIFAVGMLLFLITLVVNLVSIRFVRKYRQVYE